LRPAACPALHSFPTRRSSDLLAFPVVLLTILGLVPAFREVDENLGGRRVIDLYVPVTVLLSMIVAGVQTMPSVLSSYRERGILRDRKSTRLNSSHVKISYAVF